MSGLEVIGLVLGLIPLVIAGVGQCKNNLAGKEMRQLERHFKTQHNIFLNSIEELLSTLVSDTHLEQLMKDPNGEAWRDKAVSAKLEEQLGGAYQSFEEIMEDVKVMMEDLRERLTTDQEDIKPHRMIKRIKLFLTRSRSEVGLNRLSMRIAELGTLMGQSRRLAPARRTRGIIIEPYDKVRECALSLYDALSQAWHCECATPHLANLRLEARKPLQLKAKNSAGDNDVKFKFLFSFTADENKGGEPPNWREAELSPLVASPPSSGRISEQTVRNGTQGFEGTTESGLAISRSLRRLSTSNGSPRQKGSIRFDLSTVSTPHSSQDQEEAQEVEDTDSLEIKDLCQWMKDVKISDAGNGNCLGYLCDAKHVRYGLFRVKPRNDMEPPLASFHVGEPLSAARSRSQRDIQAKRQRFSRSLRYQLAFTLGSTILQLHSTPWLEKWAKQDILYVSGPGNDPLQNSVQPYISRRFSSSKSPVRENLSLSSEPQPQSFARNETLFTLGVVLIEIAYNKPIEYLAQPCDVAPTPAMTQHFTALRLEKLIREKMGERYQRAVVGCLYCDFGTTCSDADLANLDFQRRFLEHVVVPLEDSMQAFTSGPNQPQQCRLLD